MGNQPCVASGATPHQADISIVNNTDIALVLDTTQRCQVYCDHGGWQLRAGKIVEGREPPARIDPHTIGQFSVSGRDGSAVAPKGTVYYVNREQGLIVMIVWEASGWTSWTTSSMDVTISGIAPSGYLYSSKPWNQVLTGEANANSWTVEIRPIEGHLQEIGKAARNRNVNLNI